MRKIITFLLIGSLIFTVGCAQLSDPVTDLEQDYTEAVQKYKEIKPKLDRDFKLLFGTKNGSIDTEAIKVENYPDSGTPGIQDIVFSQYASFSDNKKEILNEANKKAIKIFNKYQSITKKVEEKGAKVGTVLQKLKELTNQKEVTVKGLTILKEFVEIAGKAYIKK